MIGMQKMTLTRDSVREALEEYVNRHLKAEHLAQLQSWTTEGYGDQQTVTVELWPRTEPCDTSMAGSGATVTGDSDGN